MSNPIEFPEQEQTRARWNSVLFATALADLLEKVPPPASVKVAAAALAVDAREACSE